MSRVSQSGVTEHHAQQLGRTIGALKAFQQDLSGPPYRIVGSVLQILHEHAQRIDRDVDVADITRADAAELVTIQRFCTTHRKRYAHTRDEEQLFVAVAGFAQERLVEVSL